MFAAMAPYGRGIVRAFLTREPMDLTHTGNGTTAAADVVSALRAAVGAKTAGDAVPVDNWSTKALVYTIEPKK
jgi:hypothetical protein